MPGNSFGQIFKITSFGESHGYALGVVIDGCPAGLHVDITFIQSELNRRRPGQSEITTERDEPDELIVVSGLFEGITTGAPICLMVKNKDQRSKDYSNLKNVFRPSHADFTYQQKYGIRDYKGGGRSSARETWARVAAGAIAKLILMQVGVKIKGYVSQVGTIELKKEYQELDLTKVEQNIVRCPDDNAAKEMISLITELKERGDTVGGVVSCVIVGCPVGLGEPVYDRLNADLAKGMLSINAVKGFDIGSGFSGTKQFGSEHNDEFEIVNDEVKSKTNNSGGIQGGISNGMDIYFKVAFKPVSTIKLEQATVNKQMESAKFKAKGRHDPCVVPRAVPIVEAMTALVLVDHWLRNKTARLLL